MTKNNTNGAERLHKLIARAGIASRRAAEEIILQGRVLVNGHKIQEAGAKADPAVDRITVDGQPLRLRQGPATVVILHKPTGVVTTKKDPEGRTTVTHLMPEKYKHLHPIGRLDFDTSGVLFLTDDGELTHLLTHPSHGVNKVYWARVRGVVSVETLKKLEGGIYLEDGKTAPCRARVRAQTEKNALVQITLREGKNRQVRRMLEAVGHPVTSLRRVKMAGFGLDNLQPGEHRALIDAEVHQLRKAAETKPKKVAKIIAKPKPKVTTNKVTTNKVTTNKVTTNKVTTNKVTTNKVVGNSEDRMNEDRVNKAPLPSARNTLKTSPANHRGARVAGKSHAPTSQPAASQPAASQRETEHPLAKRVAQRFSTADFGHDETLTARQAAFFEDRPSSSQSISGARSSARTTASSAAEKSSGKLDGKLGGKAAKKPAQSKASPKKASLKKASPKTLPKATAKTSSQADKYASKARRGARAWGAKTRKRA